MVGIELRPVTRDNVRALADLHVAPGQEPFVGANVYALAQTYVEPTWTPWGIYVDGNAVGFAVEERDQATGRTWIRRFMIADGFQGRGYGTAALTALVRMMVERYTCAHIFLDFVPGNNVAERLYARAGFVPTGEVGEDGEIVAMLAV
jgi:diamine N-acetyltransferase